MTHIGKRSRKGTGTMRDRYDDYESDVVFDVWMRGGNVDLIDSDRVRDCYDSGYYPEEAAALEMRFQRRKRGEDE